MRIPLCPAISGVHLCVSNWYCVYCFRPSRGDGPAPTGHTDRAGRPASRYDGPVAGGGALLRFVYLILLVVARMWKAFEKAGDPRGAAIVSIHDVNVMVEICGNAGWVSR